MKDLGVYLPLILIVAAFYFLVLRPARSRQQSFVKVQSELAPGARVMSDLTETIDRLVRPIEDWPEPGVTFRDITPLLADPAALAVVMLRPKSSMTSN